MGRCGPDRPVPAGNGACSRRWQQRIHPRP